MSQQLFGRRCRVQIEDVIIDTLGDRPGLRIAGKVEKTDEPKPNKLELNVYNLSQKTRDRLTKSGVSLILEAGYGDQIEVIFKGQIRPGGIAHPQEGADIVTKISSGDGDSALRGARFNASFAANTKVSDVLTKMVEALGVPADKAKERIRRGDFRGGITELTKGFNFAGPLQQEFDRRMKDAGLTWSIQDNELQVLSEKETTQHTALKLSPSTGLIGSPQHGDKDMVKFLCLLQGSLVPGRKVVIESKSLSATLKLKTSEFRFDTHGDDWFVEGQGVKV